MEKMVVIKFTNLAISFLLLLAEILLQTHAASLDITKYGAKADDKTDISKVRNTANLRCMLNTQKVL